MAVPTRWVTRTVWCAGLVLGAALEAQERPAELRLIRQPLEQWTPEAVEQQVRRIAAERPPQAEAAARSFLSSIAPGRLASGPDGRGMLDSLKRRDLDAYWMEVARLTVQFDILQNVLRLDTARAGLLAGMFGAELEARDLQREWRRADEPRRREVRARLESLMGRHFDAEQRLRDLEMRDIEARLNQARAVSARRAERRAEHVRYAVDGIIRDAERPD